MRRERRPLWLRSNACRTRPTNCLPWRSIGMPGWRCSHIYANEKIVFQIRNRYGMLCLVNGGTVDEPSAPQPITLGSFLRQARERAGFSLRGLAKIAGVAITTIQRLENDEVQHPSPIV